jgi:hypothetical protein
MTHPHPIRPDSDTLVQPSVAEVVRLFEVVAAEVDVIRRLDVCVDDLHDVQQAKATLATVDGPTLRAALVYRGRARGPAEGAGR